jgi:hypothetical protein
MIFSSADTFIYKPVRAPTQYVSIFYLSIIEISPPRFNFRQLHPQGPTSCLLHCTQQSVLSNSS